MKLAEGVHLKTLFSGGYAFLFWFVQIVGLILPIVLIVMKFFRKPLPLTLISVVVLVSAWFKRYLIVIPTMEHPFLPVQNVPESFHHYSPTSTEIMIMLFSFFAIHADHIRSGQALPGDHHLGVCGRERNR